MDRTSRPPLMRSPSSWYRNGAAESIALPRRASRVAWAAAGLSVLLLACSPLLDWRELRPDGSSAVLLFPCKPSSHARVLSLAGRSVKLSLYACQADGVTWAVAFGDVQDPAATAAVLQDMRLSAQRNLGASTSRMLPGEVAGQTPNPQAGRFEIAGNSPDGQPVRSMVQLAVRGTWVYQATVLGARLDGQAADTFFQGWRFTP